MVGGKIPGRFFTTKAQRHKERQERSADYTDFAELKFKICVLLRNLRIIGNVPTPLASSGAVCANKLADAGRFVRSGRRKENCQAENCLTEPGVSGQRRLSVGGARARGWGSEARG